MFWTSYNIPPTWQLAELTSSGIQTSPIERRKYYNDLYYLIVIEGEKLFGLLFAGYAIYKYIYQFNRKT